MGCQLLSAGEECWCAGFAPRSTGHRCAAVLTLLMHSDSSAGLATATGFMPSCEKAFEMQQKSWTWVGYRKLCRLVIIGVHDCSSV